MSTSEQHVRRIQDKLQLLLKQHTFLQKENKKLKDDLSALQQKMAGQQKSLDELKQQVTVLKINAGSLNETDKKELEKIINTYIKEIDRCIAILGK